MYSTSAQNMLYVLGPYVLVIVHHPSAHINDTSMTLTIWIWLHRKLKTVKPGIQARQQNTNRVCSWYKHSTFLKLFIASFV